MALSVSIIKKYEDEKEVIYLYGEFENEKGEFSVDKVNFEVTQLKNLESPTDRIMFMTAASKIVRCLKNSSGLPDRISYNS